MEASEGLAQNFGAMRALATVGIQAGHMRLHLRNLAVSVVSDNKDEPALIDKIVEIVLKEKIKKISIDMVEKSYQHAKSK